jgi:tetratricopeptide (TPR) repeat protein
MSQQQSKNTELDIKEIINLFQNGSAKEALIKSENLIKKDQELPFLLNLNGIININLKNWDKAKISLHKAISLDQGYVEAYNNLGIVYNNLDNLDEAIKNFSISIRLKKNYSNGYNNLGSVYDDLGKNEEAIINYSKALEFNSKHVEAQKNLIHILTHFIPTKKSGNSIIIANNALQKIKKNFTFTEDVKKIDIATLFKSSNKVIQDNIKELTFFDTQIYRRNSIDLNCKRHHKVFNDLSVIPKFCFNCFKIQIEPKNILELFKLFFIFDALKLSKNNTRKCLIELRPNISGIYKGLIYCSGMDEAEEILENISPILKKIIDNDIMIKIKRGCSEFAEKYHDYKETNKNNLNFMKYKNEWKEKERIFDINEIKNKKRNKNFKSSISGLTISDVLVMNNWLNYAKSIDDMTYKHISEDMFYSDYISKIIAPQLEKRKNEFLNL